MPVHRTAASSPRPTSRPEAVPARVPLSQAVPALLARLGDVASALEGGVPPFPPPGFAAVPDGPPSRRERALLVQFAWTAYTVLAGRPPADHAPAEWPYRLSSLVPLSQRRPDVLPALGRLIDRILTAPPLAPLPSPAGLEELLRRALARVDDDTTPIGHAPRSSTPASTPASAPAPAVVVDVDFHPSTPEPPAAVIARLRLLAGVLATSDATTPLDVRRGLFRLGWTGWERLHGEPPYRHDRPYELRLGDPAPLVTPRLAPIAVPAPLPPLLTQLLAQDVEAVTPSVPEVRAALAAMAEDAPPADAASAPAPVAPAAAVTAATVREATRILDALVAEGLVRPGASAATARGLEERLAVTSLAWSVYRAASGISPVTVDDHDDRAATPYRPLADLVPTTPPPLAAVVDATLAPDAPGSVPGAAAWLAAATQAAAWDAAPGAAPREAAAAAAQPAHPAGGAEPRRRVQLLPDDALARSTTPRWAWLAALALAATAWRLFAGP